LSEPTVVVYRLVNARTEACDRVMTASSPCVRSTRLDDVTVRKLIRLRSAAQRLWLSQLRDELGRQSASVSAIT